MPKPVILCVDDDPQILAALKAELKQAFADNCVYETAESADEALELIIELQQDGFKILLLISDWLMPGTKGDEFLIRVHEIFPEIIKILLSGHIDAAALSRAQQNAALYCCIQKPLSTPELIKKIGSSLPQTLIRPAQPLDNQHG